MDYRHIKLLKIIWIGKKHYNWYEMGFGKTFFTILTYF